SITANATSPVTVAKEVPTSRTTAAPFFDGVSWLLVAMARSSRLASTHGLPQTSHGQSDVGPSPNKLTSRRRDPTANAVGELWACPPDGGRPYCRGQEHVA